MKFDEAGYNKWRLICVEKLQSKLSQNVAKRKKNFENVVTNAAHKILRDNTLKIISNPDDFKISDRITNEAFDRMCETISAWPGVHLTQCKKLPPIFKKYWRIADNWWNRQKGKWFGDLFFWPILHYSLHVYCKKILIASDNQIEYDYLYYIFLYDILHSKVSFKKARPNPLIFDLALEKSPKLQQWFSFAGDQHKVIWEITNKTSKKSVKDCAQTWVRTIKQRKYEVYMRFKSVHNADISQILNVIPSVNSSSNRSNIKHIKRNSDSRKSIRSMSSNDNHNDSDNNSISGIEQDSDKDEIITQKYEHNNNNNNTNNNPKSEQEYKRLQEHCNRLTQVLAQQQQQISQMQFAQYIAQQQYINQQNYINESHLMDAVQQIESMQQQQQYNHNHNHIKQENIAQDMNGIYEEKSHSQYYDIQDIINQPVFLPQPTRYSASTRVSNPTPEPINILPPPLKTDAGKQRKQSYHDVLLMTQYGKDIKPESIHSLHTNHSTLTTASHTTVVTDRHGTGNNRQQTPNTIASTPSGSDVSMPQNVGNNHNVHNYYGTHGPSHNMHNINNYNNNITYPQLQIYGNQYNYGQHQYYNNGHISYNHLPPPILPQIVNNKPVSPIPNSNNRSNGNLLPPPPNGPILNGNGSRRQSGISHQSHTSHGSNGNLSDNNNINNINNINITPNHSNTNSFEMLNSSFATSDLNDNNYGNFKDLNNNEIVPFDEDMDYNINNILNNLSGPNINMNPMMNSSSNLSLRLGQGSNPNLSDNIFNSNPNNMNSCTNMSISYNGQMSISNQRLDSDQ